MDTHSGKVTSVRTIVPKTCRYCQKHPEKTLGRALLTQTGLHTILIETEPTVNNRPLTYVESDTSPISPTALTPSHLINGPILSTLPHLGKTEDNIIEKDLGHMQANQRLFYLAKLQKSIWNK